MSETVFRLMSIAAAVAYMSVRSLYERRLGRAGRFEQLRNAGAGERFDLTLVAVTSVPMWLYMLTPYFDFAAIGLPVAVRFAGLAAALASALVLAAAHRALGASWSPFGNVEPADGLVTGGVYRSVRHPMYASFFLFNLGMLALTSNWLSGLGLLGIFWLYFRRVDREERMMLGLFGDEYREYAKRTGRVFPGLGRRRLAGKRLSAYARIDRPAIDGGFARLR